MKGRPIVDASYYALEAPIPSSAALGWQLGHLAHIGLSVDALADDQEKTGRLTPLLQLACVMLEASEPKGRLRALIKLLRDVLLVRLPEGSELRQSATNWFGFDGPAAGLGIQDRRAAAAEAADKEKVGTWEKNVRPRILAALAQELDGYEKEYRRAKASLATVEISSPLVEDGAQVKVKPDVDWAARLKVYGRMSRYVESLHDDVEQFRSDCLQWQTATGVAYMERLSFAASSIPDGQRQNWLHVPDWGSSLYCFANFEVCYSDYAKREGGHWLLSSAEATQDVEGNLRDIRRAAGIGEAYLTLLAKVVSPKPNYDSFTHWLWSDSSGKNIGRQWEIFVSSCRCEKAMNRKCRVHGLLWDCNLLLDTMRTERNIIMSWSSG